MAADKGYIIAVNIFFDKIHQEDYTNVLNYNFKSLDCFSVAVTVQYRYECRKVNNIVLSLLCFMMLD